MRTAAGESHLDDCFGAHEVRATADDNAVPSLPRGIWVHNRSLRDFESVHLGLEEAKVGKVRSAVGVGEQYSVASGMQHALHKTL